MSALEAEFLMQVKAMKLPCPEPEFRFHPVRKWRFDFAWPVQKIAVEIEGGSWVGGRHNRGSGFIKDMDKYNAATMAGWSVFRFSGDHVKSGRGIDLLCAIFEGE